MSSSGLNLVWQTLTKGILSKPFHGVLLAPLDTIIFAWLLTGNPLTGLKIGLFEIVSKMLLYFGHEKLWYKINFGLDKRIKARRLDKLKSQRTIK